MAIFSALSYDYAPPIKPLAWTNTISVIPFKIYIIFHEIPETSINFGISLMPLHSDFNPFLKSKPSLSNPAS